MGDSWGGSWAAAWDLSWGVASLRRVVTGSDDLQQPVNAVLEQEFTGIRIAKDLMVVKSE